MLVLTSRLAVLRSNNTRTRRASIRNSNHKDSISAIFFRTGADFLDIYRGDVESEAEEHKVCANFLSR
jgi:hypothetical protein